MINEHINRFVYKNVSSADMGLIITDAPHVTSPERDIELISVPGKDGDIINDNGKFKNVTVTYNVNLLADERSLSLMAAKLKAWLQSEVGYYKLTDTYDPLYYRKAAYISALDIENKARQIGITSLSFNCKPFKYRIDGDRETVITKTTTIYNPEAWKSYPYIKIYGTGAVTLHIQNNSFYISNIDEYIELDSELQSAFKGTSLKNDKISFSTFPFFVPGANSVSWVGNVSKIIIKTRWCCI